MPKPSTVPVAVRRFARRILHVYSDATLAAMIRIGYDTGLLERLAEGPATSGELAERSGTQERPVREWLSALAASKVVRYDAATGRFRLPATARACLTGESPYNIASGSPLTTTGMAHLPQVVRAFRTGGGVPYSDYVPEFPRAISELNRRRYDALLVGRYLALAPGVPEALERGIAVADVGCGTGHATNLLARTFPRSRFVGYDAESVPLREARAEARRRRLSNVRFERRDAHALSRSSRFDLVILLDAIHDQVDPEGALRKVFGAMRPGGRLFAIEPKASDRLEENVGNDGAAFLYGISTLYCIMVSLAGNGVALGAAWGATRAEELLCRVGFSDIEQHDVPANALAMILVARKPSSRAGSGRRR